MGFLDKLFGRGKKAASDVGREAGDLYDKGRDKVEDAIDRDTDASAGAPATPGGGQTTPAPGAEETTGGGAHPAGGGGGGGAT